MPPLNIVIYYYRGTVIFHKAIGRVEYPFRGSNKSRNSIGKSVCNNNFIIIIINKNTGIVSFMVTQLQLGPFFVFPCKIVQDFYLTLL